MSVLGEWWAARAPRERSLIVVAGGAAVAVIGLQMLMFPALQARAEAALRYESAQAAYQEVVRGAQRFGGATAPTGPAAQGVDEAALRRLAHARAKDLGLAINRLQPGEDGALNLWFDSADPSLVFRWADTLEREHGVRVSRATMRAGEGGAVRANVVVRPGG